jgi:SAM-dependent methyltransferase
MNKEKAPMPTFSYEGYFSNDSPMDYFYDLGAFSTRLRIIPFCHGDILEVGAGLNKIFAHSKSMDVAGTPDYFSSIEKTSLPDNSFDTIIMSHVMEHVESDFLAIRECHRILRPNGRLVVLTPGGRHGICSQSEIVNNGHIRRYTRERVALLELPEFPCVHFSYVHKFYNMFWNRLKFVLKAFNYPFRKIDGKSIYERAIYRKLMKPMMRVFDYFDFRLNNRPGNALFVMKKFAPMDSFPREAATAQSTTPAVDPGE